MILLRLLSIARCSGPSLLVSYCKRHVLFLSTVKKTAILVRVEATTEQVHDGMVLKQQTLIFK